MMAAALPLTDYATSFLYPRTIAVHRSKTQAVASGAAVATLKSYTGITADTASDIASATGESGIFTGIPAGIQFKSPLSRNPGSTVPTDTHAPGAWQIMIPANAAGIGTIENRDIVIDDQGNRYRVEDSYWTAFGWQLRAQLLEV